MTAFVLMAHEESGGVSAFPDDPGVIAAAEGRGWAVRDVPDGLELHPQITAADVAAAEELAAAEEAARVRSEAARKAAATRAANRAAQEESGDTASSGEKESGGAAPSGTSKEE